MLKEPKRIIAEEPTAQEYSLYGELNQPNGLEYSQTCNFSLTNVNSTVNSYHQNFF